MDEVAPSWDAEIFGGSREGPVVLVDPDPSWAYRFEAERRRILMALGDEARRVDHIGSTSVPGLTAKPIVDIQVSVPDVEDDGRFTAALVEAGYELRAREPGHRLFRTPELDVHVHVCDHGGDWERRHLLFRDRLRASEDDRRHYLDTKRRLAARAWPSMQHYADAKTDVIAEITGRAERWAADTGWVP